MLLMLSCTLSPLLSHCHCLCRSCSPGGCVSLLSCHCCLQEVFSFALIVQSIVVPGVSMMVAHLRSTIVPSAQNGCANTCSTYRQYDMCGSCRSCSALCAADVECRWTFHADSLLQHLWQNGNGLQGNDWRETETDRDRDRDRQTDRDRDRDRDRQRQR